MSDFPTDAFLRAVPWAIGAVLVVLLGTYVASRWLGKHSVVDTAWGLLFCAVAIVSFISSQGTGDDGRRWLLFVMTMVWGLRLAWHIGSRSRGKGEDPRYKAMLEGHGTAYVVVVVYLLQGFLALLVSMPVLVGSFVPVPLSPIVIVGVAFWIVGLIFEAVGDWQLECYKSDPDRDQVLDTGLWRYTRHPNYFGDACVWLGIFLVVAPSWPGALTVLSPAVMIYLLAFGSGKRVLERSMARRPGYVDYMRRTSGFVPLPPRR
ncbi:steroid 5-alpha reductase family enzyme [Antricoccus suffuscus]|uniref:Steroid 5-alpha reductase family enzyme n=1 Tax=Antricoccus suffuscus TaxID=1629062 RepID=A0A2T1A6I7_9ACTN|nr:DUF1295 domain-containing protein [Antricoccus suffuscus]PRZ44087.1 steroid 5-alpha reductase family enzyme [Antricoccus suffuscus]